MVAPILTASIDVPAHDRRAGIHIPAVASLAPSARQGPDLGAQVLIEHGFG
jgi:hypothetical protein